MSDSNLMIFTGNANPALAAKVASKLGIPLGKAFVSKFSDGETTVEINENVRGKDVFVIRISSALRTCSVSALRFSLQVII